MPYYKHDYLELIGKYQISIDEYPRRCEIQIDHWNDLRGQLVEDKTLTHKRTHEYPSYILEALETGKSFTFAGNVMNEGLIDNLPKDSCVEVSCVADHSGIQACHVGTIPNQLAALTVKKECIYQAALLDPHTASELSIEEIRNMVDDLIEAHGDWLPEYK